LQVSLFENFYNRRMAMKRSILGSVAMACAATAFVAAQTPTPSPQTIAAQSSATPTLTLSGCIMPGMTPADPFTLSNPFIVSGSTAPGEPTAAEAAPATSVATGYRLSGSDLSAHAGKRVQIVGGLVPSANAAATAGAASSGVIGPTGMSGAGSSGIGTPVMTMLPEFRVVSVKPLEGPCPPR
jgi:hypothetical protein